MKKLFFLFPALLIIFFQTESLLVAQEGRINNMKGEKMNNFNGRRGFGRGRGLGRGRGCHFIETRRGSGNGPQDGVGRRKLDGTGPRSKTGECLRNDQEQVTGSSVQSRLGRGNGFRDGIGRRKLDGTGPRSKTGECPKSKNK